MSRPVIGRAVLLVSLVTCLGGTVAGQSSPKKPAPKKPPAEAVSAKSQPTSKSASAADDVKIRTTYTSGAQLSENTTYVKGARQRVEFPGVVSIEQYDLGRTLLLNPPSKTYFVNKHEAAPAAAAAATAGAAQAGLLAQNGAPSSPKGGIVTYTTTLTDTGERKQMFGREARHVRTVMTREASASACDKSAMTVEVDGWYIDFPAIARRATASAPAPASVPKVEPCVDKVESRTNGSAKLGFPLQMTTTTKIGEGDKQETTTSAMEVTAFEIATLDAALFDVPAGYTEVRSTADLMAGFQAGGGLSDAVLGSTADGTSTAAPKQAGTIRIGVLQPVDKSTHNLPTRELRQELAANFHKAPFEALTLAGSSVAESQAEAGRMECDYVLYSEIADIRTSRPGKVGGMLKKVSRDGPPRDVHEVKLDYKLYPVGGTGAAPAFSDTVKASSGGGFSLRSAIRLAMFAGSLYLRFSGLGLINPTLMSNFGGGLGPFANSGLFDPRMSAMSSMTQIFMSGAGNGANDIAQAAAAGVPGGGEDPEVVIRQTVDNALVNAAKGTMEQLQKNRK